jgi:hypothetical protein
MTLISRQNLLNLFPPKVISAGPPLTSVFGTSRGRQALSARVEAVAEADARAPGSVGVQHSVGSVTYRYNEEFWWDV